MVNTREYDCVKTYCANVIGISSNLANVISICSNFKCVSYSLKLLKSDRPLSKFRKFG